MITNAQNVQSDALATSGGFQAGTTSSGGANTYYGYNAGNSATGQANTFIGHSNGTGSTGDFNTIIGAYAGSTFGDSNVFIGYNSAPEGGENTSRNVFIGNNSGFTETGNDKLIIANNEEKKLIWGDFAQDQLKLNAKVSIGFGFGNYPTTAGTADVSTYNLFVNGGILTEEVRVTLQSTWADYVFKKDYKLPSLEEVEKYIKEKGHLINVPSAEEIETNGIELGEMTKIQQEKIEELTLYLIDQKKVNEEQEKEIKELKNLVQSLLQKVQDSNE